MNYPPPPFAGSSYSQCKFLYHTNLKILQHWTIASDYCFIQDCRLPTLGHYCILLKFTNERKINKNTTIRKLQVTTYGYVVLWRTGHITCSEVLIRVYCSHVSKLVNHTKKIIINASCLPGVQPLSESVGSTMGFIEPPPEKG